MFILVFASITETGEAWHSGKRRLDDAMIAMGRELLTQNKSAAPDVAMHREHAYLMTAAHILAVGRDTSTPQAHPDCDADSVKHTVHHDSS